MNPDEQDGMAAAFDRWANGMVTVLVVVWYAVILGGLAFAR